MMRINTKSLLFLIALFTFLSCKQNDKRKLDIQVDDLKKETASSSVWMKNEKKLFENNCVVYLEKEAVNNAKAYCDCLLETTIENYPNPEEAFNLEQNDIVLLFEESKCLDELLIIKIEDPWTEEVSKLFLTNCVTAQIKNEVSTKKAEEYCSCALEKVKTIIPNPHHVMSLTKSELNQVFDTCR